MAGKLGTLTLDVVAKTGSFTGPLDKASRQVKQFADAAGKAGKIVGTAIGAGAVAAVAGLGLIINKQRDLIDGQAKAAQQLDTTYTSMANLERAGELGGVGIDRITAAGRQLNLNIGEAIQGTEAQIKAFDRLGISAADLSKVPLDERISTINKALTDNVQVSERAAVAADIYGAKNAKAIQQLDPGTIAEAARQVELFGLNLSDVDAAKVEMANDAFSTFGLLGEGIGKQLTVELAPAIKAVGDLFLDSAEEAGGLGTVVQESVGKAVKALGFVVDAGDGIKRVFSVVADVIVGVYARAAGRVSQLAGVVTGALSNLPDFAGGAEYEAKSKQYAQAAKENFAVADLAAENIRKALETPLSGQGLVAAYEELQKNANAAAEATIAGRKSASESGSAFVETEDKKSKAVKKTTDSIGPQITALERAAKVWGLNADEIVIYDLKVDGATDTQLDYAKSLLDTVAGFESAKKAGDDYADLVESLRTEEEKRSDTLRDQLKIIEDMHGLTPAERNKTIDRATSGAFEDSPVFSGGDSAASGPLGELSKLDDAQKELDDWYEEQLMALEGFRRDRSDLNETWDQRERELKQEHEDSLARIETAKWQTGLAATSDFLDQLQGLRDTDSKKGAQAAKAAAIVQATINAYTAATGAYASASAIPVVGWVLGPIAAGAALAAGLANVAAIKGQAHDGIMSVPNSGTWNLEKGERVTTANTSATMDKVLADVQAGQKKASNDGNIDLTINMPPMATQRDNQMATAHTARTLNSVLRKAGRFN